MDAKEAFYAILRTLVVPIYESDQAVCYLLDRLNLPASAMTDLRTLLKQTPVMEATGLPRPFIDDVASTYTATHFRVRGTSSIACAQTGTRPGHPYADVVFAFAFHRILKTLATKLDALELRPKLPQLTRQSPSLCWGR